MKQLTLSFLLTAATLGIVAPISRAQSDGPPPIRVETCEVVVPVLVVDTSYLRVASSPNGKTVEEVSKTITDLSPADFHLFEDGSEQRIQNVTFEPLRRWCVTDNVSWHDESSCTPRGISPQQRLRRRARRGAFFKPKVSR
jgi:hypothetical protein